jgi:hypothetical protein
MTAPPDETGETEAKSAPVERETTDSAAPRGPEDAPVNVVSAAERLSRAARTKASRWRDLIWLAVLRAGISAGVGAAGILALSDDDYARVTIAERFATSPRLDPSGTSWLPFPFWITGLAMKIFDPSLEVARLVAGAQAIAATWLVYAAGRRWGLSETRALTAAALATTLPAVAVLGAMTVPEFPTAALALFAIVAVTAPRATDTATHDATGAAPRDVTDKGASSRADRAPLLAGAAMFGATLSRYETWPIAAALAVIVWRRERGHPSWRRIASAALPLLGPALWIVHNRVAHGDALIFLRRVASYRAALGSAPSSRPWVYLLGIAGGSPAPMLALALLVFAFLRANDRPAALAYLARFRGWCGCAAALLVFLLAGQAMGGAPTHHSERALLVVWLMATLAAVDLAAMLRPPFWRVAPVVLLLAVDCRNTLADRGVRREAEEHAGKQLHALVPRGERVFAATTDYGYFAIMAAFGRPADVAIDSQDPRVKTSTTLLRDPWNAVVRLRAENASWLVAPSNVVFPLTLQERIRDGHLVVYELYPRR